MKTKLLLLISILVQVDMFGQEYKPFNFEDGIWICDRKLYGETPMRSKEQYYIEDDTLINGILYHKLIKYSINTEYEPGTEPVMFFGYYGAIRNLDNKQVEIIYNWDVGDEPRIIYDFSLFVGDTIKIGYGSQYYEYYDNPLIVKSIDSIEYCGNYHKRFNLNDTTFASIPVSLIEGIGFTIGLIEPYFYQFEELSLLICYTERNNAECEDCELLLSNKMIYSNNDIKVFPNPNTGFINIHSEKLIIRYEIINDYGQIIILEDKIRNNDLNINTHLSNGKYILKIETIDQKIFTSKIIIQK